MKNNFAEELKAEKRIKAGYEKAERDCNPEVMKTARAEIKALMEEIDSKGEAYARNYRLYREAVECGNEYIDWDALLYGEKVEEFVNELRNCGIEKFTFSSGWSNAIELAWLFTQNGCVLEGFVQINNKYKDTFTNAHEKKPALLFSIR